MNKLQNRLNFQKKVAMALAGIVAIAITAPANAAFVDFIIRGTPEINYDVGTYSTPNIEFVTSEGGEKAGLGSNDINGKTIGDILQLKIDRLDDRDDSRNYPVGSGPYVAPYFNIWITDGTNYAVVANEPSNGAFQSLYNNGYDLDYADLSDKVAKIYENADKSWLPNNGVGLTFADLNLAGLTIQAPSVAELNAGWLGLGSGAPRELGTNKAYGVTWVFGDTASNYVSGDEGFVVANASLSAVPVPAAAWLFGSALGLLGWVRRRTASPLSAV